MRYASSLSIGVCMVLLVGLGGLWQTNRVSPKVAEAPPRVSEATDRDSTATVAASKPEKGSVARAGIVDELSVR